MESRGSNKKKPPITYRTRGEGSSSRLLQDQASSQGFCLYFPSLPTVLILIKSKTEAGEVALLVKCLQHRYLSFNPQHSQKESGAVRMPVILHSRGRGQDRRIPGSS